ncbi:MAG TPA: PASTA domain-containing protein [Hanamia sp.]|nr:PASTA domain-containing protein [Hanamia sp.]
MFKFIARQSFLVNLLAAIALVFLVGFLFFQSLGWITHHGEYLKVPSVTGKNVDSAIDLLEKEGFEVVITDSIYNDSLPLNTVKKQLPDPDATVKVNRTVFLNINPTTLPMIDMPNLEGLSYRFALDKLQKNHLKLGDTTNRADFMKGSVLEQHYDGKKIAAGTQVRWGSSIDLVVGGGLEAQKIPVPDLTGMTVAEARDMLKQQGIILAAILTSGDITDTASAYIYKQNPDAFSYGATPAYIQPGQTMDIWIQLQPPMISDSSKRDTSKFK